MRADVMQGRGLFQGRKWEVLKLPVIPSYQNWHLQKGKKHQVSRNGRNEFATVAT